MQTQQDQPKPILEIAWMHYAQLNVYAKKRTALNLRLRRWIGILGISATLFAILTETFPAKDYGLLGVVFQGLLITSPILGSALAAYASYSLKNGDWLVARAGAEEILKEIFTYRTVLQNTSKRQAWLEKRLIEIKRSVYRGMSGELTMPVYTGPFPPHYNPKDPKSDTGFKDLKGDEYFQFRLDNQLNWHTRKVNDRKAERDRLQVFIILAGVAGIFLSILLPIWVALAASFTAVFLGWQQLRNLDSVIRNYSKVIMELGILHDHWKNLEEHQKISTEFHKMVRSTEDMLWSQNVEYIKAMQEALKESDLDEEASLVTRVIKEARESDQRLKRSMEDSIVGFTSEKLHKGEEELSETFDAALNTLMEEASSELVQAELAAMQEAIVQRFSSLTDALKDIADEFSGVDIGRDTPPSVLNNLLSRYPKSQEAKG